MHVCIPFMYAETPEECTLGYILPDAPELPDIN